MWKRSGWAAQLQVTFLIKAENRPQNICITNLLYDHSSNNLKHVMHYVTMHISKDMKTLCTYHFSKAIVLHVKHLSLGHAEMHSAHQAQEWQIYLEHDEKS